jgi:hypothetical protein
MKEIKTVSMQGVMPITSTQYTAVHEYGVPSLSILPDT